MEAVLYTPSWESFMPTSNFRQSVIALVLAALLGAPLTSAAAPREGVGFSGLRRLSWDSATTWLWRLLDRAAKEGCRIDPDGYCQPSTKEGCRIDPNGRCADSTEPTTKEGCRIDPSGRCIP